MVNAQYRFKYRFKIQSKYDISSITPLKWKYNHMPLCVSTLTVC